MVGDSPVRQSSGRAKPEGVGEEQCYSHEGCGGSPAQIGCRCPEQRWREAVLGSLYVSLPVATRYALHGCSLDEQHAHLLNPAFALSGTIPTSPPSYEGMNSAEIEAFLAEMEPDIRAADRDLREIELLEKKDILAAGKLSDYEMLQPRLDALMKAHEEDLHKAADLEKRIAGLMNRYATNVRPRFRRLSQHSDALYRSTPFLNCLLLGMIPSEMRKLRSRSWKRNTMSKDDLALYDTPHVFCSCIADDSTHFPTSQSFRARNLLSHESLLTIHHESSFQRRLLDLLFHHGHTPQVLGRKLSCRLKNPATASFSQTTMSTNGASSSNAATTIAQAAKAAFEASQLIPASERVKALYEIRQELENAKAEILEANRRDLQVRPTCTLHMHRNR